MIARIMRKMQVPAYAPVVVGVQAAEKSGVEVELKNITPTEPIDIEVLVSEEGEEVGIGMLDISILEVVGLAEVRWCGR